LETALHVWKEPKMVGWCCVLILLGTTGLRAEERKGNMLDIYSPVKVNSSSTLSEKSKAFDPQLAIQADTSSVLDSCFISKKEINPWYTLQFTNVTSVFNVRLGVKIRENGTLETFKLRMMNSLTVYVRQSLEVARNSQQICGSPWKFNRTPFIMFTCERVLKGRFLDIIVDSSKLSQLLICSIVINIENGSDSPLNFTQERATVVSSGRRNSDPPPYLAIDGNRESCSLLSGRVKTWLRIDVRTVRYIKKLRVFFDKATETRTTIFIGRSLQSNGSKGNELCGKFGKIKKRKKLLTCEQPILGQFIYIESNSRSVNICEIEVYYDTFLNIYSSVIITASGQRYENSSIWKPIDGIRRGSFAASWISVESKLSWWQMEFPQENVISHAVINTPFLNILMRRKMLTSNIYIGNFPHDHISDNAMCEGPWSYTDNSQAKNCAGHPAGKYFIIRGWNLFIEEITLYDCEEPEVQITTSPSDQVQQEKSVNVTCQFSLKGCKVESVTWVDPNGKKITTAKNNSLDGKPASTISIKNDSFYRQFICTFEYGMESVAKQYRVRPILYVPNYTVKGSSGGTATLQVMLTVQNSTIEHQNTWTRNDDRLQQGEKYSFSTDGMTLTINNLVLDDCGNYTFTFNSDFYGNSTATIMLIVYERPSIVQQQSYENLSEGESVVVICKARSCIVDPQKISFQWQRNGELLANDDRTNISSIINGTLMILNVSKAEEGNYTCIAVSNAWNITSDAVAVTVKERPTGSSSSGTKPSFSISSKSGATILSEESSSLSANSTTADLFLQTTNLLTETYNSSTGLIRQITSTTFRTDYITKTSSSGTKYNAISTFSSLYSTGSPGLSNVLRPQVITAGTHLPTVVTSESSSSVPSVSTKDMNSSIISTPVQTEYLSESLAPSAPLTDSHYPIASTPIPNFKSSSVLSAPTQKASIPTDHPTASSTSVVSDQVISPSLSTTSTAVLTKLQTLKPHSQVPSVPTTVLVRQYTQNRSYFGRFYLQQFSTISPTDGMVAMSSSSGVRAGDIVPPLVIVAVVVAVIVIVVARKRLTKKTEEQNHEFDGEEKEKQEEESIPLVPVTMKTEEEKSDFKKSNVEKSVLLGDTALLTGCNRNNNTSVVWRFNKNELPNDNGRFRVREDGSLQISSIRLADCGVYDCEAAEISQCCTVKLTVEFPTQHPKPIKLNDFEQYLKDMHADENHGFKRQFSALEEAEHPCTIAKMPYNKKKNRYRNIVPYDHSRVVLEGKPDLDYINASYIHGYDGPNKYIATQGPMSNTVNDFWKMVWETNCLSIVMLANVLEKGKKKCEKYWPDTVQLYDNICVRLSTVVSTSEFDIRTLIVNQLPTAENEERTVKQFHFSSWPDHGVPMYPTSLLNFMKLVRAHQESSEKAGPIAVHCSAGAGRSGTYIAIENCLREIQLENELNIFRWIKEMREDRPQMVQNEVRHSFWRLYAFIAKTSEILVLSHAGAKH
jgi:protein tyrosine phosphatase